jgi:hypothetical protein
MKTLMTAALLAALALTGLAKADEPTKPTPAPTQATEKKVSLEELGSVLEQMGYTAQPVKDKQGKIVGYTIQVSRGGSNTSILLSLSPSKTRVWMYVGIMTFDEKVPATQELLLALLAKHDELWPAYVTYVPHWKQLVLSMSMDVTNFGPAALRVQLDRVLDKLQIVVDVVNKVQAAQEKGKEGGTPNPLP